MTVLKKETVLEALNNIKGPDFESDIVTLGLVSDIFIADGKVFFSITVPSERAEELEPLRKAAEQVVSALEGVQSAVVTLTAEKKGSSEPKTIKAQSGSSHSHNPAPPPRTPVPNVRHIIAVASGKGGVGKSTSAINIALALTKCGLKVGLLDADIYGPSLPRLVGLVNQKPEVIDGKTLRPIEKFGLQLMSMGFLVDEEKPMVWRGPMVMSAVTQMLRDVAWGPLDVLVVDMPPGTGDAQLTLAQQVALSGAVIISTPQDLALIDARKGIEMFVKVGVPVLGIVENMSYFIAPDTGKRYDIFGHGGAKAEAEKRNVPFLGEVPLDVTIREASDNGTPVFLSSPDSEHAHIYKQIAEKIAQKLT